MKTKFFKMGSKLVLAALALTGALFTSCEEEDLDTVFTPADPVATVTATVYYAPSAMELKNGEATVTGTGDYNTKSGAQDVKVTATMGTKSVSQTITIPQMKAGAKASFNVTLIIDDEFNIVAEAPTNETAKFNLTPDDQSHAYGHSYNDYDNWFENATEYFYPIEATFNYPDELALNNFKSSNYMQADDTNKFLKLAKAMEANKGTKTIQNSTEASAWSLVRAWAEATTTTTHYVIKGDADLEVGSFDVVEKYSGAQIYFEETYHPDHASHYQAGHATGHDGSTGHGHGTGNAGGGIVMPD